MTNPSDTGVKQDGGSAFPEVSSLQVGDHGEYHTEVYSVGGMTLRDYFAAKAMQALLPLVSDNGRWHGSMLHQISEQAYEQADAMLAARSKP